MTISKTLYSSNNEHFCTPPEVLNPIYEFKSVTLDPCANEGSFVNCNKFYFEADDGLNQEWTRNRELTYVNPPYGRKIPQWVKKSIKEWQLGAEVIMLIPARTDTKIWQEKIFSTADAICFWAGRLQFYDANTKKPALCWSKKHNKWVDAKAPFPSALIYWSQPCDDKGAWDYTLNIEKFKQIFNKYGKVR